MTSYLLDTNHLSPLITLDHPLRNKVLLQIKAGDLFAIAAPALNEFLFGIGIAKRAQQNWQEWEFLQPSFIYYRIDVADAEKAARLRINLRTRGRQLEAIDSMLAIIALENNLTLLTRDKDFQAVPALKQENWYV
ncbi:MAG: type II toxin-antitoxin system VapC family toxin [Caldilineaceae bacterium]